MEEIMNVSNWYKDLSRDDTITLLDEKITNMRLDFIAAGFYMKRVRDEEYFKTLGYETIWDFAEDRYGIQKSTASRWMAMNDKYSKEGNSPILQEDYKVFNKSQLQEMLYLTDTQLQDITPDMTVKEIREVRKPEKKITPIERGCITGFNPNGTCACCGNNGTVECCAQCTEDCNVRCGWIEEKETCATSHKEEKACSGKDCFNCSQECQERQEDRYCVEAPLGHPFSCNTMNVISLLKEEMGDKCQFINHELAYHRAGDGKAVPCCKDCDELCGYCCSRANKKREEYENSKQIESVATSQQDASAEENSCPPNQDSCPRQNWGSSKEDQEAGRKECKKCWDHYKKLHKTVETTEQIQAEQNQTEREETELIEEATSVEEVIIEGEYKKISDERYEETTEDSDIKLLKKMLDNENHMLKMLSEEYTDNDIRVRKAKLKVGAIASMLSDLEEIEVSKVKVVTEQPEMPVLKNNDQRKAFLENYQTWPIWFQVPEASETYHRYDMPDGSSIVICEYLYYSEWRKRHNNENPNTSATREYLLKPEYHYLHDCKTNTSVLVEHLKNIQKKEDSRC